MSKFILQHLWIIIIIFVFTNCNTDRGKFHLQPNAFIIDQLANKKIIMLGDFQHNYPLPLKSLTSLLEEWVRKVREGESKDYNIVLILELDSENVSVIKQFLSTGEWEPLTNYFLPFFSMEWLEFYSDLRRIYAEIVNLNERKGFPKINFDLFGGEEGNFFNHPEFLRFSKQEGSRYFIDKRDSISAKNIINYLNKNKNRKAIIFYGNLHLIKNYVKKNIAGAVPDSEAYGYYLAHYLKKEFGEDSVMSVNQYLATRQLINISPFFAAEDSNIFVYSSNIPWQKLQPQNYDGFILRQEKRAISHSLSDIFSINVIKADIRRMQFVVKYLPGYHAENTYNRLRNSLQFITGKKFNTINEWQNWIKNNKYDGLARLDSKEFKNEIFNLYYNNPDSMEIKKKLYYLGFSLKIISRQLLSKSKMEILWKDAQPKIKFVNAIGIYWVGTANEKHRAEKYLNDFIGKQHLVQMEPADYLKMYRKIYEKVNY